MPNLELTTQSQTLNFINYQVDENGKITGCDSIDINNVSVSNFIFSSLDQSYDSGRKSEGFVTKCVISKSGGVATFETNYNHIWFITPVLESESILSVDYLKLTINWYTIQELKDNNNR